MRSWEMSRFGRLKRLGYIPEDCTIEDFVNLRLSRGNLKPEETSRLTVGRVKENLNEKLVLEGFKLYGIALEDCVGKTVQEALDNKYSREVRVIKSCEIDLGFYGEYTKSYHVYLRP